MGGIKREIIINQILNFLIIVSADGFEPIPNQTMMGDEHLAICLHGFLECFRKSIDRKADFFNFHRVLYLQAIAGAIFDAVYIQQLVQVFGYFFGGGHFILKV